jgi:hypothetical protein
MEYLQLFVMPQNEHRGGTTRVVTVRLCPALHVHGVVLQERDAYNMIWHEH